MYLFIWAFRQQRIPLRCRTGLGRIELGYVRLSYVCAQTSAHTPDILVHFSYTSNARLLRHIRLRNQTNAHLHIYLFYIY
jgi:hypothetical protein